MIYVAECTFSDVVNNWFSFSFDRRMKFKATFILSESKQLNVILCTSNFINVSKKCWVKPKFCNKSLDTAVFNVPKSVLFPYTLIWWGRAWMMLRKEDEWIWGRECCVVWLCALHSDPSLCSMPLYEPIAHLCAIQSEPLDKDTLPTHKVCNTIIRSQRAFISERFKIIWGLVDNEQGMVAKARPCKWSASIHVCLPSNFLKII